MTSIGDVLVFIYWAASTHVDKPPKSVTHRQCDARPTVTFPAAGHHRPSTGTELYCLTTDAHACEQLAQGCCRKAERPRFEPATFPVASPTPRPLCHQATRPTDAGRCLYRVAQNKIPHRRIYNISATSGLILKILEAA